MILIKAIRLDSRITMASPIVTECAPMLCPICGADAGYHMKLDVVGCLDHGSNSALWLLTTQNDEWINADGDSRRKTIARLQASFWKAIEERIDDISDSH